MAKKKSKMNQQLLEYPATWGGYRAGAGRKPQSDRNRVSHKKKPELKKDCPLHVTVRLKEGLPSMRKKEAHRVLRETFAKAKDQFGFRLVHYSVMSNHIHAIVEAENQKALSKGMQALLVRVVRSLNKLWQRTGTLLADHFHQHQLTTPKQVRNALAYVLNNARRHRYRLDFPIDPFSSGVWFDGWTIAFEYTGHEDWQLPVTAARSWLLTKGWRRHGRISQWEVPGRAAKRRAA